MTPSTLREFQPSTDRSITTSRTDPSTGWLQYHYSVQAADPITTGSSSPWGVGHADDGGVSRRLAPIRPYWTGGSTLTNRSPKAGSNPSTGWLKPSRVRPPIYHYRVQSKKTNGRGGALPTTAGCHKGLSRSNRPDLTSAL